MFAGQGSSRRGFMKMLSASPLLAVSTGVALEFPPMMLVTPCRLEGVNQGSQKTCAS